MPKRLKNAQEAIGLVRRTMDTPVEFAVLTEDGGILFAGPLPPKYGNLPYPRIEGGRVIMSELEFELWEDAWSDYKKDALIKAARQASTKRTRKQAREAGVVVDLSPKLALPSCKLRKGILSTNPNTMGYLLPVKPEFAAALRAENEIDEARLEEIRDETAELDRPLLYVLYTVLQQKTMEMITEPKTIDELLEDRNYLDGDVTVFMPTFSRISGRKQNRSKDVDAGIFAKLKSFENVHGIVKEQRDGKTRYRCEPVLRLQPRKISDNSFTFSSRYMKEAILRILKNSLQYEKWDKKIAAKDQARRRTIFLPKSLLSGQVIHRGGTQ